MYIYAVYLPYIRIRLSLLLINLLSQLTIYLVEGIEKIKKQQNKDIWKTRVGNLSSNWESCHQNIFETVCYLMLQLTSKSVPVA